MINPTYTLRNRNNVEMSNIEIAFPPGRPLLFESSKLVGAGRHRVVLLEGFRLLLSEGRHHDDTAKQLQTTPVAIVTEHC